MGANLKASPLLPAPWLEVYKIGILQECRTTIVAGDWWLGTCFRDIWSHFGTTLEVFGWVLGTIGITLGAIGLL